MPLTPGTLSAASLAAGKYRQRENVCQRNVGCRDVMGAQPSLRAGGISGFSPEKTLEPISKLLEEHRDAGELHKP